MKLVTFNIRCDYQQDGINNFERRKPLIEQKLNEEQPDAIFFQEALPHVAGWLKETLAGYYVLGCGRDKALESEQVCTALKKDRFQIISMDTRWLSPEPYTPGSRFEDQSDCPRTLTEVFAQDLLSRRLYLLCNTHLDHLSSSARITGMGQALSSIRESLSRRSAFGPAEVILAGDFNALPDAAEIRMLEEDGLVVDLTGDLPGTFHDYGRLPAPEKIDYITASRLVRRTGAELWDDCRDGVWLSDHFPLCVLIGD